MNNPSKTESTPEMEDKDSKNDARTKAIESNPCGLCRVFGLPFCKGHDDGGDDEDKAPSYQPSRVEFVTLSSFLDESDAWQESSEVDLFYLLDNDLAIVKLSLDLSGGVIKFQGPKFLNQDDQDDLDALYEAITTELTQFKKELDAKNIKLDAMVTIRDNDLTIKIPDQKQYDAFISRLMDKHLIPTNQFELASKLSAQGQEKPSDQNTESDDYKSPTPFDISSGPA